MQDLSSEPKWKPQHCNGGSCQKCQFIWLLLGSKKPCCGWQLKRLCIENSWKFNRFVQNGFTNWNSNGVDFQSEIQQSCLKLGHILKQQWRCPTEIYVLTMDSIGKYWFYSFEFWAQVTLLESTPHTDESQRGEWQQHWYGLFLPPPSSHLFYLNQYQQMKHVWRGKGISVRSGCRCQPGVPVIAYHIWKFLHRFNNDTLSPSLSEMK